MKIKPWLLYSIISTLTWGVWGAVVEFPTRWGFPETLGYVAWSLTMLPCSLVALALAGWKLEKDARSVFLGSVIGFLGAGGQLMLFRALREGPAYIIFPVISLYPVLTVFLSSSLLKEKVGKKSRIGVALALIAIPLLSYQPPAGSSAASYLWLALAAFVFVAWGIQAYVMKLSNKTMSAESIFFYMMVTGLLLSPVALFMTDFHRDIHWGFRGPGLSALIQSLNSVGALFLVYAFRHGKAIVVAPMTSLAPVISILMSLVIHGILPHGIVMGGMATAAGAIYLLALE